MAKRYDEAQKIAEGVYQRSRRRIAEALARNDRELQNTFKSIAGEIRRELRATEFTENEVQRVIEKAFSRHREGRINAIEKAIRTGTLAGADAVVDTFGRVFEDEEEADPLERASRRTPTRLHKRRPPKGFGGTST